MAAAPPSPLSRLVRFGGLQAANAIAPLAVLPAVTGIIGAEGWVGLANGIGVGAAAAVAVGLAWPITGPPRVAGVGLERARAVFSESLSMRLMVLLPVCLLAVLATTLLAPAGVDPVLPGTMAVATALNGLASNWYYVGRARAGGIVTFETLPKLIATVLSVPAVMLTGQPLAYPLLLGLGAAWGVLASTREVMGGRSPFSHWRVGWARLPQQLPLGFAGLLSTGTTALTVPVATGSGMPTLATAQFAGAVRLRTMTQAGIGAGTSALQGWVAEAGTEVWRRRARKGLLVNTGLGLLGGLAITGLAPLLDAFLFGEGVEISWPTAALLGLTCLFYGISSSLTNHVLSPAGRSATIVRSTVVASMVAVGLVFLLGRSFGAPGAMGAVALSEGLVVAIQAWVARGALAHGRIVSESSADAAVPDARRSDAGGPPVPAS